MRRPQGYKIYCNKTKKDFNNKMIVARKKIKLFLGFWIVYRDSTMISAMSFAWTESSRL